MIVNVMVLRSDRPNKTPTRRVRLVILNLNVGDAAIYAAYVLTRKALSSRWIWNCAVNSGR